MIEFKSPVPKSILKQSNVGKSFFIKERWFILEAVILTRKVHNLPLEIYQTDVPNYLGPIDIFYEWNFYSPHNGKNSCTIDIITDRKKNLTVCNIDYHTEIL